MAGPLSLGPVHHLRLTVTDVERSRAFYTELLGFQIAMALLLGLRPVDAERASDRFDPFRCGLDHLSFGVAGRAELEAAAQAFEERGVEHSDFTDLPRLASRSCPSRTPMELPLSLPPRCGRAGFTQLATCI
jgi:glyoxylase I family protein